MANKELIIFSQFYPYTYYDSYFQRELFELAKFHSRIFLISGNLESDVTQPVPPNTKVFRFLPDISRKSWILFLRHFGSADFFREILNVRRIVSAKNFMHVIWYALYALEKSYRYKVFISSLIERENISTADLTIYSYWMLEHAHAAGQLKRRIPNLKIIVRAHGSDLYFERSPIHYLPLKKLMFDRASAIFFISEKGRNYFRQLHHISHSLEYKLKVSRLALPGVSIPQLKAPDKKTFFRIVSNAYVQPLKRIDLIADALGEITDAEIEWIHFGDLHEKVDQFEKFKMKVMKTLEGKSTIRVVFKGGVSNEEIFFFYENNFVDLFINVSTTEGIPVSIMEAFSFGIPAIATAVGGNPEIVNDANGKLLPADLTKEILANAIVKFINQDSEEKGHFRLNAYKTWQEKFNAEINYPDFVRAVLEINSSSQN